MLMQGRLMLQRVEKKGLSFGGLCGEGYKRNI
jgi:hypothetical protein